MELSRDEETGKFYAENTKGVREEVKMAFTDNTTYTGTDAQEKYEEIILSSPTVKNARLLPGVKNRQKVPRLVWGDDVIQDDDCTFTEGSGPTLSQRAIEVVPMKINEEICVKDLEQNYISEKLAASANAVDFIPADELDYMVRKLQQKAGQTIEKMIWNGDTGLPTGSLSLIDGLRKLVGADAAAIHVDSTGVTLDNTTIIAQLRRIYMAVPDELSGEAEDVNGVVTTAKIWLSTKLAKYYRLANAQSTTQLYIFPTATGELNFLGMPLIQTPALKGVNEMMATDSENIWFATGDVADFEDITVIPQKDKSGAPTVRMVARMTGGIQYAIPEYMVYYWPGPFPVGVTPL